MDSAPLVLGVMIVHYQPHTGDTYLSYSYDPPSSAVPDFWGDGWMDEYHLWY